MLEATSAERARSKEDAAFIHTSFNVGDAAEDLHADSLILRAHLRSAAAEAQAAWRARMAEARPRGVVISAGGVGPLGNAFATLHALRHHLHCDLPFAVM